MQRELFLKETCYSSGSVDSIFINSLDYSLLSIQVTTITFIVIKPPERNAPGHGRFIEMAANVAACFCCLIK
jgi:hypothetical protein